MDRFNCLNLPDEEWRETEALVARLESIGEAVPDVDQRFPVNQSVAAVLAFGQESGKFSLISSDLDFQGHGVNLWFLAKYRLSY
jgi:hypothetical protein